MNVQTTVKNIEEHRLFHPELLPVDEDATALLAQLWQEAEQVVAIQQVARQKPGQPTPAAAPIRVRYAFD
jgi:hypothetical protein